MFQNLLEEESDVNGIVDPTKLGFSFIDLGLTGTEELLSEGKDTGKW